MLYLLSIESFLFTYDFQDIHIFICFADCNTIRPFSPAGDFWGPWAASRITCGWCSAWSQWTRCSRQISGRCDRAYERRRKLSVVTCHRTNRLCQEAGKHTSPTQGKQNKTWSMMPVFMIHFHIYQLIINLFLLVSQDKEEKYDITYLWEKITIWRANGLY